MKNNYCKNISSLIYFNIFVLDDEQTHDEDSKSDEDETIDGEKEAKIKFDQSLPSSHTVSHAYSNSC